ncbi:U6 snRNA-associated Sm-like protein LSm7 [Testicularia cyperi]|uniref:U6 snRNA-associated Sm-like protein LSm7 n=1 Tax=Testicularia cyperi TaxID=1882483 RepID=A0A317XW36_9BASI|nr:U6 snRNA-associated Sm-like protein LSm7 [Testicularia cyperi]
MSERGRGRGGGPQQSGRGGGGRGGGRGGGGRGGGAGGRGGGGGGQGSSAAERPKKEAILDLSKYIDKEIRVKFAGGREVVGTLKGFDQLMNLVMDQVNESLRDQDGNLTGKTRPLGLVVLRGTALTVINPADGFESIENPFAQAA